MHIGERQLTSAKANAPATSAMRRYDIEIDCTFESDRFESRYQAGAQVSARLQIAKRSGRGFTRDMIPPCLSASDHISPRRRSHQDAELSKITEFEMTPPERSRTYEKLIIKFGIGLSLSLEF